MHVTIHAGLEPADWSLHREWEHACLQSPCLALYVLSNSGITVADARCNVI